MDIVHQTDNGALYQGFDWGEFLIATTVGALGGAAGYLSGGLATPYLGELGAAAFGGSAASSTNLLVGTSAQSLYKRGNLSGLSQILARGRRWRDAPWSGGRRGVLRPGKGAVRRLFLYSGTGVAAAGRALRWDATRDRCYADASGGTADTGGFGTHHMGRAGWPVAAGAARGTRRKRWNDHFSSRHDLRRCSRDRPESRIRSVEDRGKPGAQSWRRGLRRVPYLSGSNGDLLCGCRRGRRARFGSFCRSDRR